MDNFFYPGCSYSSVLLSKYSLLPVSLPEGQKVQVGQGQPAGHSLGSIFRGQVLSLKRSEDKSYSGIVNGRYNGVYPPIP